MIMPDHTPIASRFPRALRTALPWVTAVAVLAAAVLFVVPQFTVASQPSQDATLSDCLRYLRAQLFVYAAQHNNVPPGFPGNDPTQAPDAQTFVQQMTQYTDAGGRVGQRSSEQFPLGPYLLAIPSNPVTLRSGILVTTARTMPPPDEAQPYGWIYNPRTRQIIANVAGADARGVTYASY